MDNAMEINRAPQFEKILWLKAVCFAAVVGSNSLVGLFLGNNLYVTKRSTLLVEATYLILLGGTTTALIELIACFVHTKMTKQVNYVPMFLKTMGASFAAYVVSVIVPATAAIVARPVVERIVVVLVVVFGMLFLLSAIISLAGDIPFWECLMMINLVGSLVVCLSVGLSELFHRLALSPN